MDAKTLKALKGSIKKWEEIVAGAGVDRGPRNCHLCELFFEDGCYGCPVWKETGNPGCEGTPYDSWADAHIENGRSMWSHGSLKIHDDDTAIAAVLELEFLRSLLPSK